MESRVKSSQEAGGPAGLQTRGITIVPQRDLHRIRMAKDLSLRGLGEIEELGNEEVFNKMTQSLKRFMRSYPAVWSESSLQQLLEVIGESRYASLFNRESEERLRVIVNGIVVPMATIIEGERGFKAVERQKIQEATLSFQRVQDECDSALGDLKQEDDLSRRDFRKLEKALEENRNAAEEARRKLAAKEKQLHEILQKQRNLVIRLVCGGRTEFLRWAREEIQHRDLVDLNRELENAWAVTGQQEVDKNTMLISDQGSNNSPSNDVSEIPLSNWNDHKERKKKPKLHKWTCETMKLLRVVGLDVLQQAGESYDSVQGPSSIPFVLAGFWIGVAQRMTALAIATWFPQNGLGTSSTTSKQSGQENELYMKPGFKSSTTCKSRRLNDEDKGSNVEDKGSMTASTTTSETVQGR